MGEILIQLGEVGELEECGGVVRERLWCDEWRGADNVCHGCIHDEMDNSGVYERNITRTRVVEEGRGGLRPAHHVHVHTE